MCILASSGTHRSERTGQALSLYYLLYKSDLMHMPAPLVVHSAGSTYLLAQVATAVSGCGTRKYRGMIGHYVQDQ